MSKIPVMHVFGQGFEHEDCWVVGDRTSLERLKKAIELALEKPGSVQAAATMAVDGEGYDVMVVAGPDDWHDTYWDQLSFPYSDSAAKAIESRHHPIELMTREQADQYRSLKQRTDERFEA